MKSLRPNDLLVRRLERNFRAPARYAFSLIEIMVAVSLLALIIVGLLAMFYQTQRAFRSGATQMDVMAGGRAAVELITRELQEMAPLRILDDTNFLAREDVFFAFDQTMPSGPPSRNLAQNISFFTRGVDSWKVTAYHVTSPLRAKPEVPPFRLSRLVVELTTNPPPEVIAAIRNQIGVLGKYPYPEDEPLSSNPTFRRVMDGVVNFNVVGYNSEGFEYYVGSSPGLDYIYPTILIKVTNNNVVSVIATNHFPAAIDLVLGVLEPKTLDRFRAKLDNNTANLPGALGYLTNQAVGVHLFRQRIRIRTTP